MKEVYDVVRPENAAPDELLEGIADVAYPIIDSYDEEEDELEVEVAEAVCSRVSGCDLLDINMQVLDQLRELRGQLRNIATRLAATEAALGVNTPMRVSPFEALGRESGRAIKTLRKRKSKRRKLHSQMEDKDSYDDSDSSNEPNGKDRHKKRAMKNEERFFE